MDKLALKNIFTRMVAHQDGKAETPSEPVARDATILIVDDSRTVVRALQLIFEREGYLTFSAFDGQQAISIAHRHRPDVVLMDVVMPNMNGFEATRALTSDPATSAIPVIMMSGTEQVADRVWGLRLGAKGFLTKPINRDELLTKVRSAIAVARRTQEQARQAEAAITQPFTP